MQKPVDCVSRQTRLSSHILLPSAGRMPGAAGKEWLWKILSAETVGRTSSGIHRIFSDAVRPYFIGGSTRMRNRYRQPTGFCPNPSAGFHQISHHPAQIWLYPRAIRNANSILQHRTKTKGTAIRQPMQTSSPLSVGRTSQLSGYPFPPAAGSTAGGIPAFHAAGRT